MALVREVGAWWWRARRARTARFVFTAFPPALQRISKITKADKLASLIKIMAQQGHPLEGTARARWAFLFPGEAAPE